MSKLKGYCIMMTDKVVDQLIADKWDDNYTVDDDQKSDDGLMIMITGIRDGAIMEFDSYNEMLEYCYSNEWTKPEEV